MNVQRTFNRRTLLTGTVALGSVGLLAACGGSKDDKLSGKAASSAEEVVKNLQINKQDYSSLKKGGELKLSVSALGPDFNTMTQSGYTTENLAAFGGPCNIPAVVGFYNTDPAGERSINKDFCLEHKMETKDGVQTVEFKINPKAVFNDGTPIDVEAVKAYWEIYKGGGDSGYNIIPNPSWEQMESIEAVDGDKFHVKITLSTPYYLSDDLGTFATHPALVDKKLFNDGFVDKPMDQYWAGPFKVSNWNSSEKVITLAPNDKWWGEKKPLLEKIIWRQMGIDSLRAAFKNGELDAAGFTDAATYSAVKGQNGTEIRSGQNTGVQ
ncbi:MAG: ABC transporter substrate-binding protein, partial [Rothia dentocariosa]